MSLKFLKQKIALGILSVTMVGGLIWSNAVMALELAIASEVVDVTQAGPSSVTRFF